MDVAIETIDLVKRYPTTARRGREALFFGRGGRVESFGGMLKVLRGIKFIEVI